MNFEGLKENLSENRLSTYLKLADSDTSKAYDLYIKNIKLRQKFFCLLTEFEVLFRNKLNTILSAKYGYDCYNSREIFFIDKHITAIQRIKQDLYREKKEQSNPNIISNLNLGFWVYLFNKDYDLTLWRSELYKTFPNKRISRKKVREELHKIKNFRNRIAHCECILKYPYDRYYNEIIEFVSWVDPNFAKWIDEVIEWE